MHTLLQDLRYALRIVRKSPRFMLAVTGTLALTVGLCNDGLQRARCRFHPAIAL